jgi:RHS repeat-associated protein
MSRLADRQAIACVLAFAFQLLAPLCPASPRFPDLDAKHLPTRVYHTVEGVLIETSTTYNAAGNVETVTDAAGNVTSFEYDALDRLTYTRLPGPGSHYTQVMSYTDAGDPYQVRDARGSVTTFSYNKRREATGSSTTATTVDAVAQTISTQQEYDNNRNAFKVINALGRFSTSTFSATGKLLTTRHSALAGVDLVSNVYDDRDLPWTSTNVLGQTTTFTYDDASRLTDADDHLNRNLHTEKDDDGRPLSVRNVLNQTSTTIYLDAQRKSKNINPLLQEWALQTDAAGNLTHRTNARSKTWVHAYDEAGRLKTTTSPENRVSGVTWNTRGLLASATEPSLQSTTLTYDARGRLDEVTGADYALDHAYDAGGNLQTLTETTAALGARSVGRTYDEAGRLKTYTNAESETLKYIWDENGNLRFLEYPDTSRVEYQYDERDRLKFVKEAGVTMAEFQWTMANQLKKIIRANGTVRELFYDAANRLERIEERGPDGRLFYYQRCAFDDGDRMTKRLILPAPGAWNEPADTATFDGDNWMTSFNGAALTHDADGNLQATPTRPAGAASGAADASTSFGWDARNRVLSATTGATARHYTYSPDGNLTHLRTGSAAAAVGTRFTVNPHGAGGLSQVLVRTDLATNDKTKVVHGLGVLYEKRPDGSLRWLHYDHLGNTVALTNSAGAVTGRASYSLWGMQHSTSGDVQSTPFLYNGRFGVVTEAASGCLHMRARWYNPRIRRFLSSDPAGFDGGWNMFAYGNGNPLAMVDPFGLGARSSNEDGFWSSRTWNNFKHEIATRFDNGVHAGASGMAGGALTGAGIGALGFGAAAGPGAVTGGLIGAAGGFLYGFVVPPQTDQHTVMTGGLVMGMSAGTAAPFMNTRSVAANSAGTGGKFTVGAYNDIKGTVSGLDAHHVGQQALMKRLVPGYDAGTAPSILVPKVGHTIRGPNGIVSRSTSRLDNVRDVIARDINELRRVYPDVPPHPLQELIQMNKTLYPNSFVKPTP